jgi:shikimate kinase
MKKRVKIVLFGPRNVGKTNVGLFLSKKLGINFIDLDDILTEKYGSIQDIVDRKGWGYFRKVEHETLNRILSEYRDEHSIIVLGGGTVSHEYYKYREKNINILNEFQPTEKIMLLPYNDLSKNSEILFQRTHKNSKPEERKPPLTNLPPQKETTYILKIREKYYTDFASYILYTEEMNENEIADKIIKTFRLNSGSLSHEKE